MARRQSGITLTFLLYPSEDEPNKYVAHCLEFDVVAVARTRPQAITLLKELISDLWKEAASDGTLDYVFNPAPQEFWRKLLRAKPYVPPENVKKHHIEAQNIRRVDYVTAT